MFFCTLSLNLHAGDILEGVYNFFSGDNEERDKSSVGEARLHSTDLFQEEALVENENAPTHAIKVQKVRVTGVGNGGDLYVARLSLGEEARFRLTSTWAPQHKDHQNPIYRVSQRPHNVQQGNSIVSFNCFPYSGSERGEYPVKDKVFLNGLAMIEQGRVMGDRNWLNHNLDGFLCIDQNNRIEAHHLPDQDRASTDAAKKLIMDQRNRIIQEQMEFCNGNANCVVSDYVDYLIRDSQLNERLNNGKRDSRTAIGYRDLPNDQQELVLAITVNQDQSGFSLYEWGKIMKALGLKEAVNGDGGGSAWMEVRNPSNGETILSVSEQEGALFSPQGIQDNGLSDKLRPVIGLLEIVPREK